MSCNCNNRLLAQEYDRIYRLAKAFARMEGKEAVVFKNDDGSYGFKAAQEIEEDYNIIEIVTPY